MSFTDIKDPLNKVESVLTRLCYSVQPSKVINWLENFEEEDQEHALKLLKFFEYVGFEEFISRLDYQMKAIIKEIPEEEKFIVYPFGLFGKSGTLTTYPLNKTKYFKGKNKRGLITNDIAKFRDNEEYKHIIFLDDFIGSGNSFLKEYEANDIQHLLKSREWNKQFLLAAVIMEEGRKNIEEKYSYIKIYAELRYKLFDEQNSPLNIIGKDGFTKIKKLVEVNGKKIRVGRADDDYLPFGYSSSESLISFFHGTPNNTISIIWGDSSWVPLYPRSANFRISEARKFKRELAYYLGIYENLNIDVVNSLQEFELINKKGSASNNDRYNVNHTALLVLILRQMGVSDLLMCQILNLHPKELKAAFNPLYKRGLLNRHNIIVPFKGQDLVNKIVTAVKKRKFNKNVKVKSELNNQLYLPTQFNGMT